WTIDLNSIRFEEETMEHKELGTMVYNTPKQAWLKVLRFGCLFVLFEFATLAAGIGIWLICHGLWLASSRLIIYWRPARLWFLDLLKLQDERFLQMLPMPWYRWIYLIVYLSISLAFIVFGTMALVQNGFLEQNIIYWLLR
ncbi:MAG: hypothetical protein MUO77_13815, partial [Anaerolineales bacterium]|nr:hypothetical protein [Anaerolineales bacterium]